MKQDSNYIKNRQSMHSTPVLITKMDLKPSDLILELTKSSKEAIFMHCLPAHRGEEVSSELLDSKRSVVWHQAQNRMFVQQAIVLELL